MDVVTRFPPSPTGFMHIGNARTALFNWLFARHYGGKFLLRIEDTDRKRHTEEAVDVILNGLAWMGLNYDNEPVSQFANQARHTEVARKLVETGKAYYCYCSPEELQTMREDAKREGRPVFYDRRWRDKDPGEAPEGIEPVIRIKAPLDGTVTLEDEVQGQVTLNCEQIDDFIILRSDGVPTYMLAVVVDDHDMGVTHVIRGDDHLNNAFRQNVIYEAMGWDTPVYAHLPLIHGPDGKKFSKRHGAQSVEEYRDMGYLPDALCNYLLRLGWAHGDDEIISRDQAIEWFGVEGLQKSPANFDFAKLESLNAHYIKEADEGNLLEATLPFLKHTSEPGLSRLKQGLTSLKDRVKTLLQISEESEFYFFKDSFDYTDKAKKNMDAEAIKLLHKSFETLDPFTAETVEEGCRTLADEHKEGKLGKIAMPLRSALTGSHVSPPIFEAASILGKEECLRRLQQASDFLQNVPSAAE